MLFIHSTLYRQLSMSHQNWPIFLCLYISACVYKLVPINCKKKLIKVCMLTSHYKTFFANEYFALCEQRYSSDNGKQQLHTYQSFISQSYLKFSLATTQVDIRFVMLVYSCFIGHSRKLTKSGTIESNHKMTS